VRKPLVSRFSARPSAVPPRARSAHFDWLFSLITAPVWLPASALVALAIKLSAPKSARHVHADAHRTRRSAASGCNKFPHDGCGTPKS
jgi:hypothetical protein